jgi:hypothetical protein
LLFATNPAARYRALPTRTLRLDPFRMTEAQWDALGIPINMAFFSKTGTDERVVASYPGPAGATESFLGLDGWSELEEANPILRDLQPDVEALLVNRVGAAREHYVVPIDVGFHLAGLLRIHWRGLSGGVEVWEQIGRFFDRLKSRSTSTSAGAAHA